MYADFVRMTMSNSPSCLIQKHIYLQ